MKKFTIANPSFRKLLFLFIVIAGLTKQSNSQNLNLTIAGQLSYGNEPLSNIWGWVDTVDGKEYALVGAANGLSIVDISNPSAPFQVVQIPVPPSSQNCDWREVKTYGNYAYVTTECGNIGLQIVDLTNLPGTNLTTTTWTPQIGTDTLKTIHTLYVENGKVYLYGSNVGNGGAIVADIATNPSAPVYLGSFDQRYIHDGYVRNDTLYAAHIYDGDCEIVDMSNPASPSTLGLFQTPGSFTHNTWLSTDSKICFSTDEIGNSYLGAFDISNLGNIEETDRVQANPGSGAIVHNTHIIQKNNTDYAITSWYTEGITIVDASRPHNLVQVGNYDTYLPIGGFNGCWGVFPFFPSGTIVASDIETGLYVFTPNYIRACYLEGVVINCSNGTPISGVDVTIQLSNPQSNSHTDVTDFQGQYAVGVAVPDTCLVMFSKAGFYTNTDTVILSPGIVTIDSFNLCPLPTFTYSGNIYDNVTTTGIPNANISIVYDSNLRWDTITDVNGNFTIPNMFSGVYSIAVGKWGYVTKCLENQSINQTSGQLSIGLDKGIYDDFTFDFGWTVSGNATDGIWERGEPLGTSWAGGITPLNPDSDVTSDCFVEAYVTGNHGISGTDDDVDGGATTLVSPVFNLSGYLDPYIYYSRWQAIYYSSMDSLKIMLSNGTTTVSLEDLTMDTTWQWQGQWIDRNYKISSFLTPTSTMQLIVYASDNANDTNGVVEAAVDKFFILDSINSRVNEIANPVNVVVYPNPFSETTTLKVIHGSSVIGFEFKMYDVFGREVMRLPVTGNQLLIKRGSLASGMYFYKIISVQQSPDKPGLLRGEKEIAIGKLLLE